jgi:hypothetical protein
MSRAHPQHQSDLLAVLLHRSLVTTRDLAVKLGLAAALGAVVAGGILPLSATAHSSPTRPMIQPHKGKRLKSLPTVSTATQAPSENGQSSPYARAAAQRNESGRLPPGHAYVLQRPTANVGGQPGQ